MAGRTWNRTFQKMPQRIRQSKRNQTVGRVSKLECLETRSLLTPPVIAALSGSVTVGEGSTASNSGTFSDADGNGTVTLTASIGTVTSNVNGTWSWSFNTNDGPSQSQVVTITATDNTSASTQTTFNLTVANLAPTDGVAIGPVTYTGAQLDAFVTTGAASYPGGSHSVTGSRLDLTVTSVQDTILYRLPI